MREIKFRAKIKPTGKWIYGDIAHVQGEPCIQTDVSEENKHTIGWNVVPESICQFTGLQDKNGKKIYEGDIVNWHNKNYVIVFKDGMFYASIEECNRRVYVYGGFPLYSISNTLTTLDEDAICEIIGNIYDNPELLEGGKK